MPIKKPDPNATITRYGAEWPPGSGPEWELKIQMACIKRGGKWIGVKGKECGRGLFYHYKRFQEICWPDDYHHRWSDLQLKTILDSTITVVTGPKDSGKTRVCLTKFGLTDYYNFPDETLIIISSTTLAALEGRVWGDVKGMHQRAKDRFDFLPGHVLESKHAIVTDDLTDDAIIARDMRKGILCFLKDTMLSAPSGPVAIQNLRLGDEVLNATGTGTVIQTQQSIAPKLLRVILSSGVILFCTPEHPFLTGRGWTDAINLQPHERLFSHDETLHLLWGSAGSGLSEPETLLGPVPEPPATEAVPSLRGIVPASETETEPKRKLGKILQPDLCEPLGSVERAGSGSDSDRVWTLREEGYGSPQTKILLCGLPEQSKDGQLSGMWEGVLLNSAISNKDQKSFLRNILQEEIHQPTNGKPEQNSNPGALNYCSPVSKLYQPLRSQDREKELTEPGALLRDRHSLSRDQAGRGYRWRDSQDTEQGGARSEKDRSSEPTWVVSVEVLEQRSEHGFDPGAGGYPVFNISVSGHPSYVAGGVMVHNCVPCKNSSGQFTGISSYVGMKQKRRRHLGDEFQFMSPAMMDSIANMNSGDYKGVFTGNPIGQDDPLDRMSEPECGWEANPEPTTTTVWKNKRFHNSYTITLFGTDSPTYDTPDGAEKYPGLLNDDSIQRVVAGYGKDSHQYYSQCLGIRKSGLNARRVLTKDLCRQFGAFDQAVWDGSKPVTKICAVDAAYGGAGGDRCVGGHIEFGLTVGRKIGIKVYPPQIIPISIKEGGSPEDKISGWVRTYCESHQIPPENFFYDSTGRGSLGPSLARTWSVQINPVEFGGGPTDRPVSLDIFTLDQKTGRKRLKTCKEHYSKFVTELWWTVRYAIESGQIREFPMDVCDEFCGREWKEVAGGRIEIETKSEMKKRTGQSPDLADWFVTALEGARRRGFAISKLASHESSGENLDWIRKLRDDAAKLNRDRQLTF